MHGLLSIGYRSYVSQTYIKHIFFQAAVVSILLHGCTTWTLTKRIKKKLDWICTRMQPVILNKSWKSHPTKQPLYGHQPPIFKTIKIRRRHSDQFWRNKRRTQNDVLLWSPSHRRAIVGRPTRTYLQWLCTDTECCLEDLQEAMDE